MKQKTIKVKKLTFYHLTDPDAPFLTFEVSGSEKDVDEAAQRIRKQVLRMQNGIWGEARL